MANTKLSWFNETRLHLATTGIEIDGVKHKFSPVFKGKISEKRECPECKKKNAFIFKSDCDGRVYAAACLNCKQISIRMTEYKAPATVPVKVPRTICGCGAGLPAGRTKFCHTCWPPSKPAVNLF